MTVPNSSTACAVAQDTRCADALEGLEGGAATLQEADRKGLPK